MKRRLLVNLDSEDDRFLKEIAAELRTSQAQVLRWALRLYRRVVTERREHNPLLDWIEEQGRPTPSQRRKVRTRG